MTTVYDTSEIDTCLSAFNLIDGVSGLIKNYLVGSVKYIVYSGFLGDNYMNWHGKYTYGSIYENGVKIQINETLFKMWYNNIVPLNRFYGKQERDNYFVPMQQYHNFIIHEMNLQSFIDLDAYTVVNDRNIDEIYEQITARADVPQDLLFYAGLIKNNQIDDVALSYNFNVSLLILSEYKKIIDELKYVKYIADSFNVDQGQRYNPSI